MHHIGDCYISCPVEYLLLGQTPRHGDTGTRRNFYDGQLVGLDIKSIFDGILD
jgi:hypothetical protein